MTSIDELKRAKTRKESQVETYTTGGVRMGASGEDGFSDMTEAYVRDLREDIALLDAQIELAERRRGSAETE